MSKILTVDLPGRAYDIEIERGLLDRVGSGARQCCPGPRPSLWSLTAR